MPVTNLIEILPAYGHVDVTIPFPRHANLTELAGYRAARNAGFNVEILATETEHAIVIKGMVLR